MAFEDDLEGVSPAAAVSDRQQYRMDGCLTPKWCNILQMWKWDLKSEAQGLDITFSISLPV